MVRKFSVNATRVESRAAGAQVQGDVGPAEPVDGLLRIADEEEGTGVWGEVAGVEGGVDRGVRVSQQEGKLELERVGVLKLVEQDAAVPLVEGCPHGVADDGVGEQVAGDDQQVVEDQGPCMASFGGGLERGSHQIGE